MVVDKPVVLVGKGPLGCLQGNGLGRVPLVQDRALRGKVGRADNLLEMDNRLVVEVDKPLAGMDKHHAETGNRQSTAAKDKQETDNHPAMAVDKHQPVMDNHHHQEAEDTPLDHFAAEVDTAASQTQFPLLLPLVPAEVDKAH